MTSEPTSRDRRAFVLIPLAALVAVLPLIIHGCSCGHDFDFHLLSWIEAANQFSHGNLHPHWAFTPAFNAGEPRFVFYPPISWYLGAVLGMALIHLPRVSEVAGWTAAPILFTWIALAASGFAMHRLARAFAAPNAALLAAILYLANPYMLFTAYERTAYGELLAAVWMPLLLLAILREEVTAPRIAVPLALLWLTNAPAAVMGSYTLALLAAIRVIRTAAKDRSAALRLAFNAVGGTALGLALAAFYVVPAAYERRFVEISLAIVPGLRIRDNFLFGHTTGPDAAAHDLVLHTASVVALLLLVITVFALAANLLWRRSAASKDPVPAPMLTILAAGIAFLLTPWSSVLWSNAPEASFLQFPWRLLAILGVILGLAVAGMLDRLRLSFATASIAALALGAGLAFPAYSVFGQRCYIEDTPGVRLDLFHSDNGTDPTDEYTPAKADNDVLKTANPPYWLADSAEASAPADNTAGPVPSHFTITAPHAEDLILNLRDYPAWRIILDGATDPPHLHRADGLVVLPVRAGSSAIDIRYVLLPDQIVGDAVSLVGIVALVFMIFKTRLRQTR